MIFEALLALWDETTERDLEVALKFVNSRKREHKEYGKYLLMLGADDRRVELSEFYLECLRAEGPRRKK